MVITHPKWIAFVDEYMKNGNNGAEAYRTVYPLVAKRPNPLGISAAGAKNLLHREDIQAEIALRRKILTEKSATTSETILQDLIYIRDKHKDKNPTAALAAIAQICKILGLYAPEKKEVTNKTIKVIVQGEKIPKNNKTIKVSSKQHQLEATDQDFTDVVTEAQEQPEMSSDEFDDSLPFELDESSET